MIDALTVDRGLFSGTIRLVLDEAERRGWKTYAIMAGASHIYFDRGDGKLVHSFGSAPPQQSYAAGILADNKQMTNLRLESAGIPQLPSLLIEDNDSQFDGLDQFLAQHEKVVVKPVDGAHGNGIRTGLVTSDEVRRAIVYARQFSGSSRVLVQSQFEATEIHDIRLLCMSGKFVAAIHRVPARVFGDGVHTVKQLIETENASPRRGVAYKAHYARIDEDRAARYLGDDVLASVPNEGDAVRVMDVANYGAGGELIDVTDSVPAWMREEAEVAAVACDLVVAGVDYLVSELPSQELPRTEGSAVIIEINKSPALMIHDQPHEGINRQTVRVLVDMIADYEPVV